MKKLFVMFFSVLLVAFLSSSFTDTKIAPDKDVGYSLTINQITTVSFEVPTIQPVFILLSRGVSVPYKGLTNQDILTFNNFQSFECNLYYTISRLDLKLPTLTGFESQPDKYPFATDLGFRQRYSKINIV
jgi:hypothetical protein